MHFDTYICSYFESKSMKYKRFKKWFFFSDTLPLHFSDDPAVYASTLQIKKSVTKTNVAISLKTSWVVLFLRCYWQSAEWWCNNPLDFKVNSVKEIVLTKKNDNFFENWSSSVTNPILVIHAQINMQMKALSLKL